MGKRTDIKRVVVALRMAGIAGQDKLNGIFQYLSEGRRWTLAIYRTLHEFTPDTVRDEVARGADGFILGIPGADEAMRAVAASGRPAVAMNVNPSPLAHCDWTLVKSDAVAVGRVAAQTLLQQGVYKSYGFMGYRTDDDWSRERGRAYRDTLAEAGFIARMFDAAHYPNRVDDRAAVLFGTDADDRVILTLLLLIPDLGIAEVCRAVSFREHFRRDHRVLLVFDIVCAVAESQVLRLPENQSALRVPLLFHTCVNEQMPPVRRCQCAPREDAEVVVPFVRRHCGREPFPVQHIL